MNHVRRIAARVLILGIAVMAALQVGPAPVSAHLSPAGCEVNGIGLSITSTQPSANLGDQVGFKARASNIGADNCDITNVTITITTPDGVAHTALTADSLPRGGQTDWSDLVMYTIVADHVSDNKVTATASISGILHDSDSDPAGASRLANVDKSVSIPVAVGIAGACLYGSGPANDPRLVVSGTTQNSPANANVTVTVGANTKSVATAADGTWTANFATPADGTLAVSAVVSYGSGNSASTQQNVDVRSITILGGDTVTTMSHRPIITGTSGAPAGSTVAVTITTPFSTGTGQTTVDAAGHWTLTWPTDLDRDTYLVTAKVEGFCTEDQQSLEVKNNPPVAVDDSYSAEMNTPLVVPARGVLINDTDADGTPFVWQVATQPAHGHVELQFDGGFTYTPDTNFVGTDSFTYTDSDDIDVSNAATVTIHVGSSNHAPVAVNDSYSVRTGKVLTVPAKGVLKNDTDADHDPLTASPLTNTSHGTLLLLGDGSFTYTPDTGFRGTDSFTYLAEDGKSASEPATVTINVTSPPPPPSPPANRPPTANNDAYSINEDATLTVSTDGVLKNDTDPDGDHLTASLVGNPAHGTVTLSADGTLVYVPAPLFFGTDTFTYRVSDGIAWSNVATVTITVSKINHPPQARNDAYTVVQAEKLTVPAAGILGNDVDVDGDPIEALLVNATAHGTLSLDAKGAFTYLPESSFTGDDSFAYKLTDGTLQSNVAAVTIAVRPGIVPVRPVLQGIVTDAVTARAIENAEVRLMWAATPLNQQSGRTADTAAATQATTARGAYSWQVEANADYYLLAVKDGYVTFDSRTAGAIHVDTAPVNYDMQLQPIHRRFIVGYPDGSFRPDRSITRAEIAAIFARIIQPTRVELPPAPFGDVPAGHWANTYIELVREKGLMVGGPDNNFRPDAPITRAELAQILVRFRGLTPLDRGPFTDTVGSWAEQAINAAFAAGLLTGYPDNTFHPGALTTRAEAATMINRVLGRGPLSGRSAPTWPDVPFEHWASGQVEEASSSHTADAGAGGGEHWTSDTHEATW